MCVKFDFDTSLPASLRGRGKKLRRERRPHTSFRTPHDSRCRRQRTRRRHLPLSIDAAASDPMTTAAQDDPPPVLLLGPLLGNLPPDLFQQEVLRRLGPRDLASLAGTCHGCAAAVASTVLMQWANHAERIAAERHFPLGSLCLNEACSYAARCGNREVLEWLHNTGCPWDAWTTCAAAASGLLEVVKWLHNHGCPWDEITCAYAAQSGHLHVLQWAREHHCPWNSMTPAWAAGGGQLEVLQWARERGCPWDTRNVFTRRWARAPGGAAVGADARLPLE